jgi:SpoVK/Ycf46/Vps4 family AAA+-type ATPase
MAIVKERAKVDSGASVLLSTDDFEIAFAKVKPSVTREQRAGYRQLATKFGMH